MRFLISLIIMFSLFLTCAFASEVESKTFLYTSPDERFNINITYPQVSGVEDSIVEDNLNELFKKEFLTGYEDLYGEKVDFLNEEDLIFCHDDLNNYSSESTMLIEAEYTINVNKNGILSIWYGGLAILTPSAHPTKLIKTFTVNLNTGEVYKFEDLFKEGSDYMTVIDGISEKFEYYITKNDDSYDYYLTEDSLVLVNVNAPYVIQGVEGAIDFNEVKDIIDLKGPIGILLEIR